MMPRFDIGRLDDVIHGRLRLGAMAYLADAEVAEFNVLKSVLDVTAGNLSSQLRKLEEAGYVTIEKDFLGRKPRTRIRLTTAGRDAFGRYLEVLGQIVGAPRET